MTPAAAQLQFGAELIAFLGAAAAVALLLLRTDLGGDRRAGLWVALVGLASSATAAFVAGARLVESPSAALIAGPRIGGAVVVGVAGVVWAVPARARAALWAAAVLGLAGGIAGVLSDATAPHVLAGLAGLATLGLVADLARGAVAARIAASGAATLLVLLLVLSVALSSVLDSNLRDGETRRLEVRAQAASAKVKESVRTTVQNGFLINNLLQSSEGLGLTRLVALSRAGRVDVALSARLNSVSRAFQGIAYLFVSPDGAVIGDGASTAVLDDPTRAALLGAPVVSGTDCANLARTSVELVGRRAYAVATTAACTADRVTFAGRLVAVLPLDDAYLLGNADKNRDDPTASGIYPVKGVGPLAADGPQPAADEVRTLIAATTPADPRSATIGDRFVAVALVELPSTPTVVAVVTSLPTSTILETRDRLLKVLFLIALGGTLLALLLAALVGERIGARLRRLTLAAEGVQRGEPGVRAEVGGADEVGQLGATFDAMAGSIEEKTEAEGRLRGRLEAVVAGMGEALVAVDAAGLVTDFNRAAEELVGTTAREAFGAEVATVLSLVSEDGTDLVKRLEQPPRQRWLATATLAPVEGPAVPVAVSGGALRTPAGDLAGAVVVLRDLRGEREVERMKSEFLSRIGHELRTPLTGVLGYSEMLLRREFPPDRMKIMLGEISTSGQRLKRIVQMLEFFAADGAGRNQLRLTPTEPAKVVDDLLKRWESRVDAPYTLVRRVRRNLPAVDADATWLGHALDELVDNALKFSPAGGRITVTATIGDDGGVTSGDDRTGVAHRGAPRRRSGPVVFSVADKGIGMRQDELAGAFADFSQGDTSDTRRYGGLGLGLPLVARVAEGHGGEVRVATAPGRGSTFAIVVPAAGA